MKRWMCLLVSVMLILTACASAPAATTAPVVTTVPSVACDLVYDMQNYAYFAEIFDEKTDEEWDAMGRYTVLLEGLHTPVVVDMDGRDVLAVHAYGRTAELGENGRTFQCCISVDIDSVPNAVVVNFSEDYDGGTMILMENNFFEFLREGEISTQISVRDDGGLKYRRYWGEYETSFAQMDYAPLEVCASRDEFLYETGSAEIRGGEVILTVEKTVVVSDEYDLDALFAQAKADGYYEEYETADEMLAANLARANEE